MRFRPEQHLRRQSDIRAVREHGKREDCRAFTLWWFKRPSVSAPLALPRVGVVASSAAVGCAVKRALAKRRMRELFRNHQALVPPECDLLLVARSSVTAWEYTHLERVFVDACRRISPATPHA